jgi:hypothetical protein
MPLDVEGVVDRCVGGEKSLGRALGFEPLLLAFPSSDRQVGVLCPIALLKPAGSMQMPQIQDIERRAIGGQAIGGDRLRLDRLVV